MKAHKSNLTKFFILSFMFQSVCFSETILDKLKNGYLAIWHSKQTDLYLSGYAWHNRFTYSKEKIAHFNELALGGGMGKTYFDSNGNSHSLYAIGFSDSHSRFQPVVGYLYQHLFTITPNLKTGLGYTVLVTQRQDMFKHRPFPGILPWGSIQYKQAGIGATYIPGSKGAGNVLYLIGRMSWQD